MILWKNALKLVLIKVLVIHLFIALVKKKECVMMKELPQRPIVQNLSKWTITSMALFIVNKHLFLLFFVFSLLFF